MTNPYLGTAFCNLFPHNCSGSWSGQSGVNWTWLVGLKVRYKPFLGARYIWPGHGPRRLEIFLNAQAASQVAGTTILPDWDRPEAA